MSLQAYPKMKPSGVEWLGEVPEHWEVDVLKRCVKLITEKAQTHTMTVALENIESWTGRLIQSDVEYEGDGIAFALGDVLFGKLRPYLAKVLLCHKSGEAVGDFHVMRPVSDMLGQFLKYIMLTHEFILIADGSTYGAKMPRVSWEFLGQMGLPKPPPSEQRAIAAFLDRETGKIDALVAEQERLIALLAEKRRALISHAVTKGLDPNAPMKDGGIEWLGEIPAHWEVKRLKHIGYFKAGSGFPDDEQGVEGEALSFHKVNALAKASSDGCLVRSEDTVSYETAKRLRAFVFPERTIVFAKIGAALLLGRIRSLIEPACIDNNMMGFMLYAPNNSKYVRYIMSLVRFDLIANPGAVPSLNAAPIENISFGIAPPEEQGNIVAYLDRETAKLDALTAEAERAIGLLRERRGALISAAVTGKIDVREGVAAGGAAA